MSGICQKLIISENLGHHNQEWPRNLPFKLFLSISLLKEHIILCRFYINITGCIGITIYWIEIIFTISIKENIVLVKLFETSFGSNIIVSFTKFQCQGTETFVLFKCKLLKFRLKVIVYINDAWILPLKVDELSLLVISEINSSD